MVRRNNDIKAPDGYTLGGLRLVRSDGTILFGRGWWTAPKEWIGQRVWVHEDWATTDAAGKYCGEHLVLEAASPGLHIYAARMMKPPNTVICRRSGRGDAKPQHRSAHAKAWFARPTNQGEERS